LEILQKKDEMARGVESRSMTPEGDREDHVMDELKLFYTGIIRSMQYQQGVAKVENEDAIDMVDALKKRVEMSEQEAEDLRRRVTITEKKSNEKKDELKMVKRDIECLKVVIKEDERKHIDNLISLQSKIKNCLMELNKLQSVSAAAGTSTDCGLYTKIFPTPSPPSLASVGLLEFSNLFYLSGQLVQFCQGQHGSKLVVDRIRVGTEPERNLVRDELDLPRSLGLVLESGNEFCKEVVLALVETDMRTRVEVLGRAKRDKEAFSRIDGGQEFLKRLEHIVGEMI